jgi:hypothetical protein
MSSLGTVGSISGSAAGAHVADTAAEVGDGKEEAAAFLKQLARTALTMASNSLMEAQDTQSDLEDGDDE